MTSSGRLPFSGTVIDLFGSKLEFVHATREIMADAARNTHIIISDSTNNTLHTGLIIIETSSFGI
jgi:hypothetical protein